MSPRSKSRWQWIRARGVKVWAPVAAVLTLAAALGFKPLESLLKPVPPAAAPRAAAPPAAAPPAAAPPAAAPVATVQSASRPPASRTRQPKPIVNGATFNVVSNNQSGGVTAGQYFEQPARRALSRDGMRDGLLSLLGRRGARVEVISQVEPESMQFEYEIDRLLDSKGFEVLDPTNFMLGGRPFYGQNVYETNGVYVIEVGFDDGSRGWKQGPSMTASMFNHPEDFSKTPRIAAELLRAPGR